LALEDHDDPLGFFQLFDRLFRPGGIDALPGVPGTTWTSDPGPMGARFSAAGNDREAFVVGSVWQVVKNSPVRMRRID